MIEKKTIASISESFGRTAKCIEPSLEPLQEFGAKVTGICKHFIDPFIDNQKKSMGNPGKVFTQALHAMKGC